MELKLFSKKQSAEHFERLAAEHERKVYAACYHMMGNQEDAMDCAQETMLRAFRAFDSFRRDAQFSTWITRIAMNVCVDELRKRKEALSLEKMQEETGFDMDACGDYIGFLEETMAFMEDPAQTRQLCCKPMMIMNVVGISGITIADYDTRTIDLSSPILQSCSCSEEKLEIIG